MTMKCDDSNNEMLLGNDLHLSLDVTQIIKLRKVIGRD